jgi:thiol-disulfide isomerase/thioredoxin
VWYVNIPQARREKTGEFVGICFSFKYPRFLLSLYVQEEALTRSSVISFFWGLFVGFFVLAAVAGAWFLYARSVIVSRLDKQGKEIVEGDNSSKIRLAGPVFKEQDFGRFDYTWSPQEIGGDSIVFEGLRERVLFINVWATWCRPCIAEMPQIYELSVWASQENLPVDFFLVTLESNEVVREFLKHTPLPLPVISAQEDLPACLWTQKFPTTFIVDPNGNICLSYTGATSWFSSESKAFLLGLLTDCTKKDLAPRVGKVYRLEPDKGV